jgi:hypothetical protein
VITVVDAPDAPDAVQRGIHAVTDLVTNGLIVTSEVENIKYAHRATGQRLATSL